ncbi:LysR family transcriptional regulator [Actinophytocola gossypii]|uniref:LysR family transcriptional regulator n=1 Tax=Actinophytocola gossypii TaxID=2812003 RepID=A0ABT2JCR9_9PSEU|nr:LysR substrate-binding domain-containing protein [Actinophytocola gossypii]MCT2585099.1 LysR family transcriptional regulator [Actinophytocola gossypii]
MDLRLLRYFAVVADERNFGRAANRLHMTQPPLSRAIRRLERDLGAVLLERSPRGVTLTSAGEALYREARDLLERADRTRARVAEAAGGMSVTIGTLADSVRETGSRLARAFREQHPAVPVTVREADFGDPSAGLHAGVVDLALTLLPFDTTGLRTRVLRTDPVGAVLRLDDPLAGRAGISLADLADRQWFRFPDTTDPLWCEFWTGAAPPHASRPVVRTASECLQAVVWNNTVGLIPLSHDLPEGLTAVPLVDQPPTELVVAWRADDGNPLVRSLVRMAVDGHQDATESSSQ